MGCIETGTIYDVHYNSLRRISVLLEHPFFGESSAVQIEALMSCVVLGGVVEVVCSNLARGEIFTASIGSFELLYPSTYIIL